MKIRVYDVTSFKVTEFRKKELIKKLLKQTMLELWGLTPEKGAQ